MSAFWRKKSDDKIGPAMVKMARARGRLYVKYPRLYDTMDLCHVSPSNLVPTLAVVPRRNGEFDFLWNPEFINELTELQVEGCIKHELLHIVFEHTTTRLPQYDFDVFDEEANKHVKADDVIKARIWNIATDCAINQFIRADLQDPNGKDLDLVFPEKFQVPEWLNAEAYYHLLAEQYKDEMELLKKLQKALLDAHQQWEQEGQKQQQQGQGQGQGQPQPGQSGQGEGEEEGEGQGQEGEGSEGNGKNQPSSSVAGHGGATDSKPGEGKEIKASEIGKGEGKEEGKEEAQGQAEKDAEDREANQQAVKDIAEDLGVPQFNEQADRAMARNQKGGNQAGKYGGVGSNVVVMDYGAGEKATPGWMRKTKHESVHGFDIVIEQTRKRPNRRYGNLFPGKRRQDTGNKLLIAVDISGSISMELFKKFTQHVNKFTRFSDFDIVFFNDYLVDAEGRILYSAYDSKADPRKAIRKFRLNQKQAMGGGTNFETLMLLWNRVCNQYDGLFVFTDGEASYSTAPRHPRTINWVVYPHESDWNPNAQKLAHLKHGNVYNMNNEKYSREMPRTK